MVTPLSERGNSPLSPRLPMTFLEAVCEPHIDDFYVGRPLILEPQFPGCSSGKVNDSFFCKGSAIVNPDDHAPTVLQIGDFGHTR